MQTVYIYADGSDLEAVEGRLMSVFSSLAEKWSRHGALVVNQRSPRTLDMRPEDLSDWFIGLNLPLENFTQSRVLELTPILKALAASTRREFVVGIAHEQGVTGDVVSFGAESTERAQQLLLDHVAAP